MVESKRVALRNHYMSVQYVKNSHPAFTAPAHHEERPAFIRKLFNFARKRKVAMWEGFYTIRPYSPVEPYNPLPLRQRRFNKHRARAIQAITESIAHHLNLITGISQVSIEMLAHQCGLATKSKNGNESITRASRAVITLEQYGILKCEKIWDKTAGTWIPKLIEATPLFIEMCGVPFSDFEAAQRKQLGFKKSGLPMDEQEQITVNEFRRRAAEEHRRIAFERRAKQNKDHAARKLAKKLMVKPLDEQRHDITRLLSKRLGKEELIRLGLDGVKALVNQELGRLRRIADSPPI